MSSSVKPSAARTPVQPITVTGNPSNTISYRAAGQQTVSLRSANLGVQQLAGFNPAAGDVLGLSSILGTTLAHADLSDIGKYITSATSAAGTTLYFDPTGSGLVGTPFAVLQGVATSVAQLVAAGGLQYMPDPVTLTPSFATPFTLRPDGLETVNLRVSAPGFGPQEINGIDPAKGDVLQLGNILSATTANPDLSNVQNYISATYSGGNTIVLVDATGSGKPGTAFAVLNGVHTTVAQLLADHALLFTPSPTMVTATPAANFLFRPEGSETAVISAQCIKGGPAHLQGFSLALGDKLDLFLVLANAGVQADATNVTDYISATQSGGATTLWFDPTGSGHGGSAIAVLQNTSVTVAQLLAQQAIVTTTNDPILVSTQGGVQSIMVMGNPSQTITFRAAGHETVCLKAANHGVQQLVGFNAAAGDVLGLNDVLETTLAHADLSDVGKYITSIASSVGTTLYFDPTGSGHAGTKFAVLQGVTTSVAQLAANGGIKYLPDPITLTPSFNTPFTLRPDGLETVNLLAPVPSIGTQQINGFDPAKGDALELASILNPTTARPDLSNIQDYISATHSGGNTILSVDQSGSGQPGTPFAALTGVDTTVAQLTADKALVFDPTPVLLSANPALTFVFRPEGNETALLNGMPTKTGAMQFEGFSLGAGDALDVRNIIASANVHADMTSIGQYVSATQSGGATTLWFDPTGSGHGGAAFAMLQHTSVTVADLIAHQALHLT